MIEKVKDILSARFPAEIVEHILHTYHEMEVNYRLEKWKPSELDSGHFVEAVRRLLENELFGSFTPFDKGIDSFNQKVLNQYEFCPGDEVLRILIPRVLYAMYCVRNKRGVGHISAISPNKLDATFLLQSAKWVLAELVRFSSTSSPDEALSLINQIIERQVDLIWDDGETFMVLDGKLTLRDRVLICLYKSDYTPIEILQKRVDYINTSRFKQCLQKYKDQKLIDITPSNICKLSPLGAQEAEKILNR